jgi:hypothetical protein
MFSDHYACNLHNEEEDIVVSFTIKFKKYMLVYSSCLHYCKYRNRLFNVHSCLNILDY